MKKAEIKNREEEAKARNFRMYQEASEKTRIYQKWKRTCGDP